MEYIYRAAAKQLFGVEVPSGSLPLKAIRNTDLREATLEVHPSPRFLPVPWQPSPEWLLAQRMVLSIHHQADADLSGSQCISRIYP